MCTKSCYVSAPFKITLNKNDLLIADYLSDAKYSKMGTTEEFPKMEFDIMRFRLYEVNFDLTSLHHFRYSKTYSRTFWGVLIIIICGLKIGLIVCKSQYVKFLFMNLLHNPAAWLFNMWQIIGNSLKCVLVNSLVNNFSPVNQGLGIMGWHGTTEESGMTGMTQGWSKAIPKGLG